MAIKLRVLFTLALLHLVKAQEDICSCNKEQIESERQALWDVITVKFDNEDYPALPALIGPLVPCGNCLNYDRKKRTILPGVTETENKGVEKKRDVTSIGVHDRRCPKDYVRIAGVLCVPVDYFDE